MPSGSGRVRRASPSELEDWDSRAVIASGGHVLQSVAWARYRESLGRRSWFGIAGDGTRVLAMIRPWPVVGGGSAYAARGPIAGLATAEVLDGLARALAHDGVDVLAADPEVPGSDQAYRDRMRATGFHPIDELQPSRDRMVVPLGASIDEAAAFARIAKSTRQRIRAAEKGGLVVVRHDAHDVDDSKDDGAEEGFAAPAELTEAALGRFETMLRATASRRGFVVGPFDLRWWRIAFDAGWLVHLEARDGGVDGAVVAALGLFRHGGRISTAHSADVVESRTAHPGALHLLRWRAMQLAIRTGSSELDLGGVDVADARREPRPGEPMYGLFEHKRSFGAVWVTQAGTFERVERPWRYGLGRTAARIFRVRDRARVAPADETEVAAKDGATQAAAKDDG